MLFVPLLAVAFSLSHWRSFSHSSGNVLECTSKCSCTFYIAITQRRKKTDRRTKLNWNGKQWNKIAWASVSVSDIECTNGFFLSCGCDVNKKRGNHFAHLQPHSVSSSGACVCMYAFVCLLVYGSMRACMSSSTHMQYAFSKHTSEQRIAPQRLMLMKINRPTVVQIALFPPFHLYDFVSVFLVGYFARATNLISLSQIGYFPHT